MYKLKIGIPISADMSPTSGGSFSYINQLTKAIDLYEFDDRIEIVFLDFTGKLNVPYNKGHLSFHPFKNPTINDLIRKVKILFLRNIKYFSKVLSKIEIKHSKRRDKFIVKKLKSEGINTLFYLNPDGNTFDFPFITTHWDIGHCSTYMFPEFSESFESRKNYYENILPKALMILTETETGKNQLTNYTKINTDRIHVMPIYPGSVINEKVDINVRSEILEKYDVEKNNFFIYPAQFWAHKNHILLINAFKKVLSKHPTVKLILTGSDKGNLEYVKSYINNLNLSTYIKILGFVSNTELFTFYKHAIALVMPTFLGPSNMPPLEAANLGCNVILSNIEGHKELIGDYGSYFKPTDVNELEKILLNHLEFTIEKKIFTNSSIFSITNAMKSLEVGLLKALEIRINWG